MDALLQHLKCQLVILFENLVHFTGTPFEMIECYPVLLYALQNTVNECID